MLSRNFCQKILSAVTLFWQKFRKINSLTKDFTKELISRNIFSVRENFTFFPHYWVLFPFWSAVCLHFFRFSDAVTIEQTELQGRYTIANRDIEPGEIIAIDRPVVKHLDKEFTKNHCWHCLTSTQNFAIVPCSMCSGILFCSELCRQTAQETYHK